jgi:hypothetical protein
VKLLDECAMSNSVFFLGESKISTFSSLPIKSNSYGRVHHGFITKWHLGGMDVAFHLLLISSSPADGASRAWPFWPRGQKLEPKGVTTT